MKKRGKLNSQCINHIRICENHTRLMLALRGKLWEMSFIVLLGRVLAASTSGGSEYT